MQTLKRAALALGIGFVIALATPAAAQTQIPAPSAPVTLCGTLQTGAGVIAPTTWQMIFTPPGGPAGAPEAITVSAPTACAAGATHAFQIPPTRFSLGQSFVQVRTSSAAGGTVVGNTWSITLSVTGAFTITGVLAPPD